MKRKLLSAIAIAAIFSAAAYAASEVPFDPEHSFYGQQENEAQDTDAYAENQIVDPLPATELVYGSEDEDSASLDQAGDEEIVMAAVRAEKKAKKDPCRAYGLYYAGVNRKTGNVLCCRKGEFLLKGTTTCARRAKGSGKPNSHHGGGGGHHSSGGGGNGGGGCGPVPPGCTQWGNCSLSCGGQTYSQNSNGWHNQNGEPCHWLGNNCI